jgi:hypothetical protein
MMQKRGSSGLSATLAAAGLADPDILALAQVGTNRGMLTVCRCVGGVCYAC